MKCPQCGRYMIKIEGGEIPSNSYYYMCRHCNYISEIFNDDNEPLGDNHPCFPDYDESLSNWRFNKKWEKTSELKAEHKKIINNMQKKLGKITDNDEAELLIWLWEIETGKERLDD